MFTSIEIESDYKDVLRHSNVHWLDVEETFWNDFFSRREIELFLTENNVRHNQMTLGFNSIYRHNLLSKFVKSKEEKKNSSVVCPVNFS